MMRLTHLLVAMSLLPPLLSAAPVPPEAAATQKAPVTSTAATMPTSRPASVRRGGADPAAAAVRAAVVALTREHQQFLRGAGAGAGAALREESNYFKENPDDAVTVDAIVAALQSRGGDARTACYVKWQLLSGLPDDADELEPAATKQLLATYRAAPQPIPRPGMSAQDRLKLDVYVQGRKQSDEADLKAYLDTAVAQVARHNNVILKYRDELYRRLPKSPETFAAGMDDVMQRLNAAAEGKDLLKQLVADVREWATLEARPPHVMAALARAARKLADMKGPQYYQSPYWHRSNVFAWRKARGSVDSASKLKDLAVYLEELAAQPPLELKEKK